MKNVTFQGRRRLIGAAAGLSLFALGGTGLFWAVDRRSRRSPEGAADQAFEVDLDSVINGGLESIAKAIRLELRRAGVGLKSLSVERYKIVVTLEPGDQGDIAFDRILEIWPELTVSNENGRYEATFPEALLARVRRDILMRTLAVVQASLGEHGIDRGAIRIGGNRCILVPVEKSEAGTTRLKHSGSQAKLSFRMVDLIIDPATTGTEVLPWIKNFYNVYPGSMAVRKRAIPAGEYLADAQVELEDGNPIIVLRLDIFTRDQRRTRLPDDNQLIAIVLDKQIVATVLARDLRLDRTVLRGPFTRARAEEMAFILRSLALPAPLKVVEACPDS